LPVEKGAQLHIDLHFALEGFYTDKECKLAVITVESSNYEDEIKNVMECLGTRGSF
jgi:hypothetical protein